MHVIHGALTASDRHLEEIASRCFVRPVFGSHLNHKHVLHSGEAEVLEMLRNSVFVDCKLSVRWSTHTSAIACPLPI